MNSSHDLGDVLKAKPSPIASESRQFVFLPGKNTPDDNVVLQAWIRWTGAFNRFVWASENAHTCGICIFRRGDLEEDARPLVVPFFKTGGVEANVFEYVPEEGIFRRLTRALFDAYYPIPALTK